MTSIHLPPTATGVIYTPSSSRNTSTQPRISPIAHFNSTPNDGHGNETFSPDKAIPTAGRLLAVNSSYIAYAVKKGLVRVIDRQSSSKALLRGHASRIVDACFFGESQKEGVCGLWKELAVKNGSGGGAGDGSATPPPLASDILATIGGSVSDSLFIWRIYNDGELKADKLIELKFVNASPARIIWHPFDPNRFLLLNRKGNAIDGRSAGSLVETKRLVTQRVEEGHMSMVCDSDGILVPGATQFLVDDSAGSNELMGVNDAAWSGKDARHVLTAHDDGQVRLWDVIAPIVDVSDHDESGDANKIKSFQCTAQLRVAEFSVTRVIFLSQYEYNNDQNCITPPFLTGTNMNHTLTLWSGFFSSNQTCQKLRVFSLQTTSPPSISTLLSVELCPAPYRPSDTTPSSFILIAEQDEPRMHALHLDTHWKEPHQSSVAVSGFDFVTTLDVVHPILSQCLAASSDNALVDEERDVDLCCVQTKAVQLLTLSGEMVAKPVGSAAEGISDAIQLMEESNNDLMEGDGDDGGEEEEFEEEEYDMEDEGVEYSTEHDNNNVIDDNVIDDDASKPKHPTEVTDPFANWLGTLAASNSNNATSILPPTSTVKSPPPPPPGLDFMFPPPPGMTAETVTAVKKEMALLSPMELLNKNVEPDVAVSSRAVQDAAETKKKKSKGKKSPPPPVAILQRQEKEVRPASHPSGSNVDIRSMESVMAKHMKEFESKVADAVRSAVASEVDKVIGGTNFNKTLEKAARENAALAAREAVGSMQAPLLTSFNETMKEIMIPAYEAATTQMFHQISKSVDQGLAQIAANQSQATQHQMEAMSQQMAKMAEAIQTLSVEISQLKTASASTASTTNGTQPDAKPKQPTVDIRQEILTLCQSHRYEEAFTKAVSAANGDIVVFTCKHADINAAFSGDVTLSQTILICLMQQLGAVLISATDPVDFKIITTWLQEIAVTIDPENENIKRHVGSVVQQLLSNINSKMSKCDPAFRRPLQTLMQVIRGLL